MGWYGLDWSGSGLGPVNAVISLWVPHDTGMFLSGCTSGGLSNSVQLHTVSYIYLGNNLWL
jgi:hypothetical protein